MLFKSWHAIFMTFSSSLSSNSSAKRSASVLASFSPSWFCVGFINSRYLFVSIYLSTSSLFSLRCITILLLPCFCFFKKKFAMPLLSLTGLQAWETGCVTLSLFIGTRCSSSLQVHQILVSEHFNNVVRIKVILFDFLILVVGKVCGQGKRDTASTWIGRRTGQYNQGRWNNAEA